MMSDSEHSHKAEKLLLALFDCPTIKQAAIQAGVSYATARRMLEEPSVQARLKELRELATKEALNEAIALSRTARETLAQAMADTEAPLSVRVRAAEVALSYSYRALEQYELAERIDAIEQRLRNTAR